MSKKPRSEVEKERKGEREKGKCTDKKWRKSIRETETDERYWLFNPYGYVLRSKEKGSPSIV